MERVVAAVRPTIRAVREPPRRLGSDSPYREVENSGLSGTGLPSRASRGRTHERSMNGAPMAGRTGEAALTELSWDHAAQLEGALRSGR
jgi:hypothetical protein